VIGVTILRIRQLILVHLFVGLLIMGPVALKLASTGYRFMRYYTRNCGDLEKGPPPPALRLISPGVVLTTVIVFVSGIVLMFVGPARRDTPLLIHKASFIVWIGLTALHVLGHLPGLSTTLRGGGRGWRECRRPRGLKPLDRARGSGGGRARVGDRSGSRLSHLDGHGGLPAPSRAIRPAPNHRGCTLASRAAPSISCNACAQTRPIARSAR
jgi:hypothetical protein